MAVKVLAFTGAMGSGKTTLMNLVATKVDRYVARVKFAKPLYDIQAYVYERTGLKMEGEKDRRLMQFLGTDWGRDKDVNLWVNIWKREVDIIARAFPHALIMADDLRFPNEAKAVKEMHGLITLVTCPLPTRQSRIPVSGISHASEAGIPTSYVNSIVSNAGSLMDLDKLADALLETLYL